MADTPKPVKVVGMRHPIVSLRPRVMDGGIDIMLDDFMYVSVNYDYRYTDNASRHALAEKIAGILRGESTDALRSARLEGRREMRLTLGDSPQKTAAWQAFIKSMGAQMPQNADGTYEGMWFVSVMEAIKAYVEALDPEPPETPTDKTA